MANMKIFVNGSEMNIQKTTNVSRLLEFMQEFHTPDMIVEINHRFIHAEAYDATLFKEGDRMEVIYLAMGG